MYPFSKICSQIQKIFGKKNPISNFLINLKISVNFKKYIIFFRSSLEFRKMFQFLKFVHSCRKCLGILRNVLIFIKLE